ncbi:hypothetical protein CCYN2B_90048 [Capnocytophaga cynodegmi]|uniref:Uncharacterized protein n=1 Tax=Capnocytophaga cynodegmi TaxID=28189 RepID=A0A0B7HQD1_9FLAO|nr:hypothetical protein CCYN2B_90048 [Capnocytophaga cynodegmi]
MIIRYKTLNTTEDYVIFRVYNNISLKSLNKFLHKKISEKK